MSRSTLIGFAALWLGVALLVSNAGAIDWTYGYSDTFDSTKAESDSYAHSLFWSSDMTPLPQPYLYYFDLYGDTGIAFVDYQGQEAELCYAFSLPSSQTQRLVTGTIEVAVSFPSTTYISQVESGTLSYRTSPNGMTWSDPIWLGEGYHQIDVDCPEGTCYLRFSGTRAMITYLAVSQYSEALPIWVSASASGSTILQSTISSDLIRNGDVIEVEAGTYAGPIDFKGKSITVRSASGASATTINCTAANRGVYLNGQYAVLSGFTIKGARVSGDGGGIYVASGSPTIANCVIMDCQATTGGGICVAAGAQPLIINCTIGTKTSACTAAQGAGIALLTNSNATIIDCTIEGNRTTGAGLGGGLYCLNGAASLSGCRIGDNTAKSGGGVYCSGADVTLGNTLIVRNSANAAAGIYATAQSEVTISNCTIAQNTSGAVQASGSTVEIDSSIIWGNGGSPLSGSGISANYSDIEYGYSGTSNLNANPLFVSSTDFHLLSMNGWYSSGSWPRSSSNSPCIDAGNPDKSAAVEPGPDGGRINMGAYGASPQASKGATHTIFHVDKNGGSDYYTGLSRDRAFLTIKKAVEAAKKSGNGSTILIWPGTYTFETTNDEIFVSGMAVRIQSAADPAIITAKNAFAFSFYDCEGSATVLSNLIIKGCKEGAIFCDGASPTLENLTIVSNACGVYAVDNADPDIVNCIFWNNYSTAGNITDLFQCTATYSLWNRKLNGKVAVTDPYFADADNGDYHLKSRYGRYLPSSYSWTGIGYDSVNSPCIDAGNPDLIYYYPRAEPMPNGRRIDMGAHGGTPYASLSNWPSY